MSYVKLEDKLASDARYRVRNSEKLKAWRDANREKRKEYDRSYYQANRVKLLEQDRIYRKANPGKIAAKTRAYYEANREKIIAQNKAYCDARPGWRKNYSRGYKLKLKYGLSNTEWNALFEKQEKCCAICGSSKSDKTGWHTDHCHSTASVRGILCGPCNKGIGLLRDDPVIIRKALAYLEALK